MNRTDRLYALVEKLRACAPQTVRAAELARHFEVSVRTIERDLLALQEAGVPIWAQPGPGGGYGLPVDVTLPPLNLTPSEAAAIATALAAVNAMPLAGAGQSALQKIMAVMAVDSKNTASDLVGHIRVVRAESSVANSTVELLQHALIDGVAIEIDYKDAEGAETHRIIEPAGIFNTPNGWFLAAWCRLRCSFRAFLLDRISRILPTQEQITPRSIDSFLIELPYDFFEPALK